MIQHPWNGSFLSYLRQFPPKYCLILLKWAGVVLNKTNTVFRKSLKILNFGSNGTHPKFTVLLHFGAQFTARKPKTLPKIRISGKTTNKLKSLGISNKISLRSQKNHIILVKLSNIYIYLGGGLGSKLLPDPTSKRHHKFSFILLYDYSSRCQVSASGYLLFPTLPKRNN